MPATASPLVALPVLAAALLLGVWAFAMIDHAARAWIAGSGGGARRAGGSHALAPLREAALLLVTQRVRTERPDSPAWVLAPGLYLGLAAAGLAVVPWSAGLAPADIPAGIVLWGSVEALAVVAIFLHGWSANAHMPLIGAYRYVALGLAYMLVSMFVLIAAALPAESLRLSAIVESQRGLWNVIRQPLGLPLFLFVGLGVAFWGPLDFADSADLAGGTAADVSGPQRLAWELARRAMLVAFAAVAATVFLGGWLGPWLPGPVWLALKTLLILGLLALLGHTTPRIATDRVITLVWVGLLPASFVGLLAAGIVALP